jgi:anti-sigma factor RsiW
MHETPVPPHDDALAFQALLYAGGEMEAGEAQLFERRLGEDQAAREALCRAVRAASALAGHIPPAPDPAYREEVRRRLRPDPLRALVQRRSYRGHPLLWIGLGAAAAVLLTFGIGAMAPSVPPASLPTGSDATTVAPAPAPRRAEPLRPSSVDMANLWAELNSNDHLAKAREEEMRRKVRAEGHRPRTEEHRQRPMGNMGIVH